MARNVVPMGPIWRRSLLPRSVSSPALIQETSAIAQFTKPAGWLEDSCSHTQSGPIRVQLASRSAIGSRTNSAFAAMRSSPRRARL